MYKQYLEAGRVVAVHGVAGEMKLYPWCDSPDFLRGLKNLYLDDNGQQKLSVVSLRPHKNMALVKLEDCDSVEAARRYIDRTLYFDRGDIELEKGATYVCDLLGLPVKDADSGEIYGTLADVTNHGASDVFHVATPSGETRMIPAVDEIVIKKDLEKGEILVRPIKGMFSDED